MLFIDFLSMLKTQIHVLSKKCKLPGIFRRFARLSSLQCVIDLPRPGTECVSRPRRSGGVRGRVNSELRTLLDHGQATHVLRAAHGGKADKDVQMCPRVKTRNLGYRSYRYMIHNFGCRCM